MPKANVGITITVAPSFENIAKAFRSTNINGTVNDYIREYAFTVERYAKQVVPVNTGRLRASIATFLSPSVQEARVGTNVEYAYFVHEGTKRMKSRPFMRHAVDFAGRKFSDEGLADKLDKEIRYRLSKL